LAHRDIWLQRKTRSPSIDLGHGSRDGLSLCHGINDFSIRSYCRAGNCRSRAATPAQYITKLPRAEHDAKERQAAMEALLLVAEHDGPTQFARIRDSES
jgi:hypothetical protein